MGYFLALEFIGKLLLYEKIYHIQIQATILVLKLLTCWETKIWFMNYNMHFP